MRPSRGTSDDVGSLNLLSSHLGLGKSKASIVGHLRAANSSCFCVCMCVMSCKVLMFCVAKAYDCILLVAVCTKTVVTVQPYLGMNI